MTERLISDFGDAAFQAAFRTYFTELGIRVKDWDGLFREMTADGNFAYLHLENGAVAGFILFQPITLSSGFLEEQAGLIREFWVAPAHRGQGRGGALLRNAEAFFRARGVCRALLTTDTAASLYEKRGYRALRSCRAKNGDPVYEKDLRANPA